MQTRQPDAHHGGYEPLGHGRCSLHGASQHPDPPRGVSNGRRPHRGGCVCPRTFSTFEDRSFGGLSDVLKERLGVGLLGSLTTCTFRRLVHVSLANGWSSFSSTRRSCSSDTRGSSLGNSPMQLVASFVSLQLVLTLQCSVGVDQQRSSRGKWAARPLKRDSD